MQKPDRRARALRIHPGCGPLLFAVLAAACGGSQAPRRANDPWRAADARPALPATDSAFEPDDPDRAEAGRRGCTWPWIREQLGGELDLTRFVGGDAGDLDGALRRLFPRAAHRPIAQGRRPDPGALFFRYSTFPAYRFGLPIDWSADPHRDNSWRLWFQSLSWLHQFHGPLERDLDAGGQVLVEWANGALRREPPLDFTWSDHALAVRLDRSARFLDRYVSGKRVLDRAVLRAGAEILATHFQALGSDRCYHARHNHGVRQDLAILEHVGRYPALRQAPRLRETAEARLHDQIAASVTSDGIQVENSPQYHLYYAEMLARAVAVVGDGRTLPAWLIQTRDRMLEAMVHLLQPNLTLPQFGDSDNRPARRRLLDLLTAARRSTLGDSAVLDRLEWVVTRGRRGTAPGPVDRVFTEAGYAAFREAWTADDPSQIVTGHLKCGRLSLSHYRPDETSFEVYGRGTELVVNPGIHSYEPSDRFASYQRSAAAQNVLVVDDGPASPALLDHEPCVVAHELGNEVSWVQAVARSGQGATVVRTFAHAKPSTFVVVDHVRAVGTHRYAQHFHLHPHLSDVRVTDARTVVARSADAGHAGIALAAAADPTSIETFRGETGDRVRGWYFPRRNVASPSTDVVFLWDRAGPELDLALVLAVLDPGAEPRLPERVTYAETADQATVTWSLAGRSRSVVVPRR